MANGKVNLASLPDYNLYWTPQQTVAGSTYDDNLGQFTGDTEDFDCDFVGSTRYSDTNANGLGATVQGSSFLSMEDPDGGYVVELKSVIVPRDETTPRFVYAEYAAKDGTVYFDIKYQDTCGVSFQERATFVMGSVDPVWTNYSFQLPANATRVDVSVGFNSSLASSVAYFDVVAVGEDGCMDKSAPLYNENAVIQRQAYVNSTTNISYPCGTGVTDSSSAVAGVAHAIMQSRIHDTQQKLTRVASLLSQVESLI